MDKIIEICSQNDFQHITNFEWYITVLSELSRMEGGSKHGKLIASQLMDVAIRVASIRPFAVSQMALLIENHSVFFGTSSRNSESSCEVLYAASWICGEFSEHLQAPEETLKALFLSKAIGCLPGHILSIYLQNGMKLFSVIAGNLLEAEDQDSVEKVKELASYLEDKVLKDLVLSSDLEVQERASVMHQFLKYVTKHLEKNDDLAADFTVFFAGELNPVAPKAQKKVPIPEGLDLDAWINEPPPPEEESESDESAGEDYNYHDFTKKNNSRDMFGIAGGAAANNYDLSPSKRTYVEPTKAELVKSREARLAQQSSDPFYLKESSTKSPIRSSSASANNNVSDIPVQKIDLDVPLEITGLATSDQYLEMKQQNGKPEKKKKKKKKLKKKDHEDDDGAEEDDEQVVVAPSVFVSKNAEMPEGVKFSDGDDNDSDEHANDDPHRALGEINLDDLEDLRRESPSRSVNVDDSSSVPVQLFGSSGGPITKKKKKTEKVKKDKKEKKEKKKKKKKDDDHDKPMEEIVAVVVNGETTTNDANVDDLDFWLSPSKKPNPNQVVVKSTTAAPKEEIKHKKSKKKKKSSKDVDSSHQMITTNGIGTTSSAPPPSALALKVLAENKDLKMLYDVKKVPLDPLKMTAGISFVNVGTNAIVGVELDFVDTPNISVVREDTLKGIKVEMELGSGKMEDHLFLFNVSKYYFFLQVHDVEKV